MMRSLGSAVFLVLAMGSAIAADIAPMKDQAFARYTNDRFGASAEVPAFGFSPRQPAMNGEGRSWVAEPDVEISVFGNYWSVTADTFGAYRDLLRSYLLADGAEITYEPERANRFVFSGYLAD